MLGVKSNIIGRITNKNFLYLMINVCLKEIQARNRDSSVIYHIKYIIKK